MIFITSIQNTKTGQLSESRRKFIEKAGATTVMALFGTAFFTSCSSDDPEPANSTPPPVENGITVSGDTIRIDLNIQDDLTNDGSWLLILDAQTLVANVGGSFIALTSVCTHSGCDRNWTYDNEEFTCTCHNSKFDTTGNVLQGPANQPLTAFNTVVSGQTLTINK
jgi:cytochrome b6-f complex iron-sulfur subunit